MLRALQAKAQQFRLARLARVCTSCFRLFRVEHEAGDDSRIIGLPFLGCLSPGVHIFFNSTFYSFALYSAEMLYSSTQGLASSQENRAETR